MKNHTQECIRACKYFDFDIFRSFDLTLTLFLSIACTVCCLLLYNSCNRIQMKITIYCLLLRIGWRGSPRGKSKCSHFEFDCFSEHCLFDIQSLQELDSVQHSVLNSVLHPVLHSSISSKSFPGIVETNIILERMNWKYFIITTTDLTWCQSEIFFRLPRVWKLGVWRSETLTLELFQRDCDLAKLLFPYHLRV